MGCFTALLIFSAAFYLRGAAAAEQQPDYRQSDAFAEHHLTGGEADGTPTEEMEAALLRDGSSSPVR